ncbi:hypothetical protein FOMPIDRAFT_88570 [Fomitopsis schrenkii]|uniref:DUF7702 domain-containing protein n=1 Tax=Fomitopsis schrenkii TaxID=2126942 RepID=S8DVG8_FOMSC|nr:hypothetical protein FOMPIDRAFT_88570 [Fomitopsis schrenkii]
MPSINYAKAFGIQSLAAAIVFTILYAPLLGLYISQAIRRRTRVYIVLTLFCLMRVTAFALRSALAGSNAAATNESTLIAFEVIYSTGFFGLLYSAYTLVLERESLVEMDTFMAYCPGPLQLLFQLTRRRMLIRLVLMVAVALGIAGAVETANATTLADLNQSSALRSASVYIFLAVTCLLVIHALVLSFATMRTLAKRTRTGQLPMSSYSPSQTSSTSGPARASGTYEILVLLTIAALLLAREAFYAATAHNLRQQTNEHLFYPLSALTELIAVVLFAVPGLVPAQNELPQEERQMGILA